MNAIRLIVTVWCVAAIGAVAAAQGFPRDIPASRRPDARGFADHVRAVRARLELQAMYRIAGFPAAPARVVEVPRTGVQLCIERELGPGTLVEIDFDPGVTAEWALGWPALQLYATTPV